MGNGTAWNIHLMHASMDAAEYVRSHGEVSEQDRRIASLKAELRYRMGDEQFIEFYKSTSFSSNLLEKQLRERLACYQDSTVI